MGDDGGRDETERLEAILRNKQRLDELKQRRLDRKTLSHTAPTKQAKRWWEDDHQDHAIASSSRERTGSNPSGSLTWSPSRGNRSKPIAFTPELGSSKSHWLKGKGAQQTSTSVTKYDVEAGFKEDPGAALSFPVSSAQPSDYLTTGIDKSVSSRTSLSFDLSKSYTHTEDISPVDRGGFEDLLKLRIAKATGFFEEDLNAIADGGDDELGDELGYDSMIDDDDLEELNRDDAGEEEQEQVREDEEEENEDGNGFSDDDEKSAQLDKSSQACSMRRYAEEQRATDQHIEEEGEGDEHEYSEDHEDYQQSGEEDGIENIDETDPTVVFRERSEAANDAASSPHQQLAEGGYGPMAISENSESGFDSLSEYSGLAQVSKPGAELLSLSGALLAELDKTGSEKDVESVNTGVHKVTLSIHAFQRGESESIPDSHDQLSSEKSTAVNPNVPDTSGGHVEASDTLNAPVEGSTIIKPGTRDGGFGELNYGNEKENLPLNDELVLQTGAEEKSVDSDTGVEFATQLTDDPRPGTVIKQAPQNPDLHSAVGDPDLHLDDFPVTKFRKLEGSGSRPNFNLTFDDFVFMSDRNEPTNLLNSIPADHGQLVGGHRVPTTKRASEAERIARLKRLNEKRARSAPTPCPIWKPPSKTPANIPASELPAPAHTISKVPVSSRILARSLKKVPNEAPFFRSAVHIDHGIPESPQVATSHTNAGQISPKKLRIQEISEGNSSNTESELKLIREELSKREQELVKLREALDEKVAQNLTMKEELALAERLKLQDEDDTSRRRQRLANAFNEDNGMQSLLKEMEDQENIIRGGE
ncbi:hypothetical protein BJ742DRAFT_259699 [Cladochytrium replicatum]|nr:hypothetical protein BJ742DRAFT_259699 [Cladochytrium replicatum]